MKLFFLIFLSVLCSFSYGQSQLKIEPEVVDFGVIKEADGVVKAKFKLTNTSRRPYIMNYSYSSCGCVSTKVTKEPLLPGRSREVTVEFNPKRRPGVFNKSMSLISNNKKYVDELRIRGEVIPKVKSIEELYPIKSLSGLQLSEDKFPFGILSQNEKHTGVINLFNNSQTTINVEARCVGDALGTVVLSSREIKVGKEAQLQFTYDLRDNRRFGELKNVVKLFVNGVEWKHPIDIKALVIYNFFDMSDDERKLAPRAIISPTTYNTVSETVPIFNNGKSDLKVLSVIVSDINVTYTLSSEVIKANQRGSITVKAPKGGSVTLLFNSPDTPIVEIRLSTNK